MRILVKTLVVVTLICGLFACESSYASILLPDAEAEIPIDTGFSASADRGNPSSPTSPEIGKTPEVPAGSMSGPSTIGAGHSSAFFALVGPSWVSDPEFAIRLSVSNPLFIPDPPLLSLLDPPRWNSDQL